MNRATVLLTALFGIALLLDCTSKSVESSEQKDASKEKPKTVEALKPPEVKRNEPIVFKMADYDVKEWKAKSKAEATSWFKVKGDEWWVDWGY